MILNGQKLNQDELNSAFVCRSPFASDADFEAAQPGGFNPSAFNIYCNSTTNTIRFYNKSTGMWEDLGSGGGSTSTGSGAPVTPGTVDGEYYFDTAEDDFYKWEASSGQWILLTDQEDLATFGSGAPTTAPPSNGPNTYIDTSVSPPCVYEWNGTSWLLLGEEPPVASGTADPTTAPVHNQAPFFYNSNSDQMFFYDGAAWVPLYQDLGTGGTNTRGLLNSGAQTIPGCKTFTAPINNNYIASFPLQGQQVNADPFKPVAWTGSGIFTATGGGAIAAQADWETLPKPSAACPINGVVILGNRSGFPLNMKHLATTSPTEVNFSFCSGQDFILETGCYVMGYYSEADCRIFLTEENIVFPDPAVTVDRTSVIYSTNLQADLVNVPNNGCSTYFGTQLASVANTNDSQVTKIGHNLAPNNSRPQNVIIGCNVFQNATGMEESVGIGVDSGAGVTTGDDITLIGVEALQTAPATFSEVIGAKAAQFSTSVVNSTVIGASAGQNSALDSAVIIGRSAAQNGTDFQRATVIGHEAARTAGVDYGNGVFIGQNAANSGTNLDSSTIVGRNTHKNVQGADTRFTTILGINSGDYNSGRNNMFIGENLHMAQAAVGTTAPAESFETIMRVRNNSALTFSNDAYWEDYASTQAAIMQTGRGLSTSGNTGSRTLRFQSGDIEGTGVGGNIQFATSKANGANAAGTRIAQTVDIHVDSQTGNIGFGGLVAPTFPIHHNNGAHVTAGGVWTDASDEKLKEKIRDCDVGLKELMRLKPKKFEYKAENMERVGFIAQEVEQVLPEAVSKASSYMGVSSQGIVALLVKSVQELTERVEELSKKTPGKGETSSRPALTKELYQIQSVAFLKKYRKADHIKCATEFGAPIKSRMTEEQIIKVIKEHIGG